MKPLRYIETSAEISACGRYRYTLFRRWAPGPVCVFVMLNPSTADALQDDPTIRRCVGFARREGCGALLVVNLFAYRATDPDELLMAVDPEGPERTRYLRAAIEQADGPVIAAWGSWMGCRYLGQEVARAFPGRFLCLGTTKSGAPKHPLYMHASTPLVPFEA